MADLGSVEKEKEQQWKFLLDLLGADSHYYCFQEQNLKLWPLNTSSLAQRYQNMGPPIIGRNFGHVKHYDYPALKMLTDDFCEENLIQRTQYHSLFRVTVSDDDGVAKEVTVKTFDLRYPPSPRQYFACTKLLCELMFFTDEKLTSSRDKPNKLIELMNVLKPHKNLVKVIGFSCDKCLAVVYDSKKVQVLVSLIPSESFDWAGRIALAMEIAQLIISVHNLNYALGTIHAKNIMVDEDGFKLFEPSLHFLGNESVPHIFIRSYAAWAPECRGGEVSLKTDVYAYGILLLELISRRLYDEDCGLENWLMDAHRYGKPVVDTNFEVDAIFEVEISCLILSCFEPCPSKRPDMTEILTFLEKYYGDASYKPGKKPKKG